MIFRWIAPMLLPLAAVLAIPVLADDAAVPQPPKFIIGVWYQPARSLATWKERGINTLVGYEGEGGNVTKEEWCRAARQAGLFYIFKPSADPDQRKREAADPYLLAWEQPDEPDGAGNIPSDTIVANYQQWRASGNTPILLNFDGGKMQWRPAADYLAYLKGCDWVAFDYYGLNYGNGPESIPVIGQRLDTLKQWTEGKKRLLAFIECSDQNIKIQNWVKDDPLALKMRGPTADEMLAEVDQAVTHGADGIVYFPQRIGFNFEAFESMTPEVEAAMRKVNATLAARNAAQPPKPAAPQTVPQANAKTKAIDPLDGKIVTIDGRRYRLQRAD